MSTAQRIIRYFAIGLAVLIIVSIFSGVIALASAIAGGFGAGEKPDKELKYTESFGKATLNSLNLELGATNLTVKEGDLAIKTNNPDISWSFDSGILTVKEKEHFLNNNVYTLELYIPKDTDLEEVSIVAGVGEILIPVLKTNTLTLKLGVGSADIGELFVGLQAEIDGGVGRLKLASGEISELDFDMGVGEADLSITIKENAEINGGIGSMKLKLLNGKDNYKLTASKGIGEVTVDGKQIQNDTTVGDGASYIEISGGIGDITVEFE